MKSWIYTVIPVINYSVRGLCAKPYEGHPKGCPNFRSRETCPPTAPFFGDAFDLSKPVYAITETFNLAAHVLSMKRKHPDWSDRQARCCLYWQGGVRKALNDSVNRFLQHHPGLICTDCPEAMGVDVTATMAAVGVQLEWPPESYVTKIALAGSPVGEKLEDTSGR